MHLEQYIDVSASETNRRFSLAQASVKKKRSFYASLRPAVQQHKLLSSP